MEVEASLPLQIADEKILSSERIPVIFASVVVAIQVGIPFERARTKPLVVEAMRPNVLPGVP